MSLAVDLFCLGLCQDKKVEKCFALADLFIPAPTIVLREEYSHCCKVIESKKRTIPHLCL